MTDKSNQKDILPGIDELVDIDNLPPLDHDEATPPDPLDLTSFIEPLDDNNGTDELPKPEDNNPLNPLAVARDLIDDAIIDGDSFIEDWQPAPPMEIELDVEQEEVGFTEDPDEEEPDPFETDWFFETDSVPSGEMDEGEEGPTNERMDSYEFEEDGWDAFDEEGEEELEVTLEAMERLGIDFPSTHEETTAPPSPVFETQFLGPATGGINTAVFHGGSLVAAGESLFSLGADGMFHGTWNEDLPALNANSVYVRGDSIFLGTQELGAIMTQDRGVRFRQLNTWFTQGLFRNVQASSDHVSTSFSICGQETQGGFRLLGRTERGQLFASVDGGKTWRSLAIPAPCVNLTPIHGTTGFLMASCSKSEGIAFQTATELDEWHPKPLPPFWPGSLSESAVSMAANDSVRIVGVQDVKAKLAFSLDCGTTWTRVDELSGVSAVALDPDDPACMAAAAFDILAGAYTVFYSEDQGSNWQTVLNLEGIRTNRIIDLAIRSGRTREIAVVTKRGVYLITLTRRGVSH